MDLDVVIRVLFNQGKKTVWFYEAEDSTGAKAFQLLDRYGDEQALRWVGDGAGRWRMESSLLPVHLGVPGCATEYDLPAERLQLLAQDVMNGSAGLVLPGK